MTRLNKFLICLTAVLTVTLGIFGLTGCVESKKPTQLYVLDEDGVWYVRAEDAAGDNPAFVITDVEDAKARVVMYELEQETGLTATIAKSIATRPYFTEEASMTVWIVLAENDRMFVVDMRYNNSNLAIEFVDVVKEI